MSGSGRQTVDHWWPVTKDFGLIRADVDVVGATRAKQYADAGVQMTTTLISGALEEPFERLLPLSPAPTKEMFLATSFGWTAFFSSGARGSGPSLPMVQLSRALGVMALRICCAAEAARYPAVILEVYDIPEAGGSKYGYRRSIAAANDGGRWVFEQSGTPFAFEDPTQYGARRKRDRFTAQMLWSFLAELGVPRLSDETLQPDGQCRGVFLARPAHSHLPQYTLAEAKAL